MKSNIYYNKLRNLDNSFVDKSIPYITISNVNGQLSIPFDKEGVAKKCEIKGKKCQCQWTGKTAKEIIQMWEDKATTSREYGKKVDAYTDCILNEDGDALELYKLDNDIEHDERLKLIESNENKFYVKGRLDALFYNKRTDTWIVIDWKSNESITTRHNNFTEHLLGPAKDLYAIDWNTYTLQVYNYKEALLQNYLPIGTEPSHVQCMIVNLPKAEYDNVDAVLGKGQKYKAYMGAFPYDEGKINNIYEYAFKKDRLTRKNKLEEENLHKIKEESTNKENFDLF